VRLVTRAHFWSRDKDSGHTIWSAISGNFVVLCFYRAIWNADAV